MSTQNLLEVRDVCVDYLTANGLVRAVDHVSLDIKPGETLGLAGESGCGKSTLAFSIAKLHKPPALISEGQVLFEGHDVLSFDDNRMRDFRWDEVSVVFQSAMNCLNPVMTIGNQVCDVILAHQPISYEQARERAKELFGVVGIHHNRLDNYPHQFSGGIRQRAVIAITLALNPKLILMDEPTTALDVVVERDIMEELAVLKDKFGFAILLISHDLSLMGEISDRIGVMYAGQLLELGTSEQIIFDPQHPYTKGLIGSFPTLHGPKKELTGIKGNPLNLLNPPPGCYFGIRCSECMDICRKRKPDFFKLKDGRSAKCFLFDPSQSN